MMALRLIYLAPLSLVLRRYAKPSHAKITFLIFPTNLPRNLIGTALLLSELAVRATCVLLIPHSRSILISKTMNKLKLLWIRAHSSLLSTSLFGE